MLFKGSAELKPQRLQPGSLFLSFVFLSVLTAMLNSKRNTILEDDATTFSDFILQEEAMFCGSALPGEARQWPPLPLPLSCLFGCAHDAAV